MPSFASSRKLREILSTKVTKVDITRYEEENGDWLVLGPDDPHLKRLGITLSGENVQVAVSSLENPIGNVNVTVKKSGCLLLFENSAWCGQLHANVRLHGGGCSGLFNLRGQGVIRLRNVLMRSSLQTLFWGYDSTAVDCEVIELEGEEAVIAIGDDVMISPGVFIRNFDMHSLVDLVSMKRLNQPVNMVVERHVWLGQDVLLLCCQRVGYGSVIGARSLARNSIPPKVVAAGNPVRVIREHRSWGRGIEGMSPAEIELLSYLDNVVDCI